MTPTFTVVMGTLGRPSLKDTLDSIARQRRQPGDQVLVGIDTHGQGRRPDVEALVRSYGAAFEVTSCDAGIGCWGTAQINACLDTFEATGSHLLTVGDDDVYVDGAWDCLRAVCARDPQRPVLARFLAPWREVLWDRPTLTRSRISGCCIAAPRAYAPRMPEMNAHGHPYPEHDFDWMTAIVAAAATDGHVPVWLDQVLVIARPEWRGADVTHRPLWRCWACEQWMYGEDVSLVRMVKCPRCGVSTDLRPASRVTASPDVVYA